MGVRVDGVIAQAPVAEGNVALFAHDHVLRVLRRVGSDCGERQPAFLLGTGSLCVLGCYRDIPAVKVWNGHLLWLKSR